MEYMSIKGGVELRSDCQLEYLDKDVQQALEKVHFINEDGIVLSTVKFGRLWILGEGLLRETQGDKFIGIVKRLYAYTDKTCRIDVQRIRWELNIIISNDHSEPDPHSEELLFLEAC